ncbi:MAG: geranylgeranyl pyrophosphate synthetase [Phycisphaerales bacterium]|nr:MAG: geranylgeranyl pyrophosphate synthetase [Phycisphaerales bacterium]
MAHDPTSRTFAGLPMDAGGDRCLPQRLAEIARLVDARLDAAIDRACQVAVMASAVRYAALGPGKRLRPALVVLSARACGGSDEPALTAAAAVELVHAFSLVHDDLPCMDDDDLRRGRPTLHVHADEATALLAGDAMLNAAYLLLATDVSDGALAARLTAELARACAAMIDGQAMDTLERVDPHAADARAHLERVHRCKTGALLEASCRMGALCADATPGQLRALTDYASAVGLMYQIVDDLIDVEQPAEHAGKRTGKDARAGKVTFPAVLGVQASRERVQALLEQARDALAPLGSAAADLAELAGVLARRDR